jgi:glycosyltransferase involved in cell wall biosynthesis
MRCMLLQKLVYIPTYGGANKSNRLLMEELTRRGHECAMLVPQVESFGGGGPKASDIRREVAMRSIALQWDTFDLLLFIHLGVHVYALAVGLGFFEELQLEQLRRCITDFRPDCILVSSEDPGQILLQAALSFSIPVVYLARTTLALPFGPDSAAQDENGPLLLQKTNAVVCVSDYVKDYCIRWAGVPAVTLPISLYESQSPQHHGRFGAGVVMMINPCVVKGLSIFVDLVSSFPQQRFGVVPTWGTTAKDLDEIRSYCNIEIIMPNESIDEVLMQAQVLVVPSLWAEGKARVILEAMARGVPVLASNAGGNPEAKLGVDYTIPVNTITKYERAVDDRFIPVGEIPVQDLLPWRAALAELLSNPIRYEEISNASRAAALAQIETLTIEPLESLLSSIVKR